LNLYLRSQIYVTIRICNMSRGHGEIQKKILLLLLGGLALGLSRSPKMSFKIIDAIAKEWKEIDERKLKRSIKMLYKEKLLDDIYNKDGTTTLILSKEGKKFALTYNLENIKIKKPSKWDRKWRIVIFDIPEYLKKVRESLRMHLRDLSFYELQKSVFVHPYECSKEIEYIVEFYRIKKHVRFIVADSIDNELHIRQLFNLS
jgi:DNA-binding transcriptional regulator PaaX